MNNDFILVLALARIVRKLRAYYNENKSILGNNERFLILAQIADYSALMRNCNKNQLTNN